jgi:homoserine kinase
VLVSAPASSANLGPGFDCLGLALDLAFRLAVGAEPPAGFHRAEDTHPAVGAFRAAGGDPGVPLWWHSPIPPGRGLGFSGAARVAGAFAAARAAGLDPDAARGRAMAIATRLEGHADNAAASAAGGFVVTAGPRVVRLAVGPEVRVVTWSPEAATSTDASRRALPGVVALEDAAFSVGRAALWVAAVATGDLDALRVACEDRLHQDHRLADRPDSAATLRWLLDRADVLAAWLSGSGPTVAALTRAGDADGVAAGTPDGGRVRVLGVDDRGVHTVTDS